MTARPTAKMALSPTETVSSLKELKPHPLPYHAECSVCGSTNDLKQCQICGLSFFCRSGLHKDHEATHKKICQFLGWAAWMRDESKKRMAQFDDTTSATARSDEAEICRDWGFATVLQLAAINTRPAVTEALKAVEIYLSEVPHSFCFEYIVLESYPPLMSMRLGLDQTAHDIARRLLAPEKQRAHSRESSFDWFVQELIQSYQTRAAVSHKLRPEDEGTHVFMKIGFILVSPGPPGLNPTDYSNFAHLLLHKVKALLCLQSMGNVGLLTQRVPPELLFRIRYFMATTTMTNSVEFYRQLITGKSLELWEVSLQDDIKLLFDTVDRRCPSLWPLLSNIDDLAGPMAGAHGFQSQGKTLCLIYAIFRETPGALEWINAYTQDRITPEEVLRRKQQAVRNIEAANEVTRIITTPGYVEDGDGNLEGDYDDEQRELDLEAAEIAAEAKYDEDDSDEGNSDEDDDDEDDDDEDESDENDSDGEDEEGDQDDE